MGQRKAGDQASRASPGGGPLLPAQEYEAAARIPGVAQQASHQQVGRRYGSGTEICPSVERPISLRNDVDVVDDVVLEPSFEESVKDELVLKNIGARDLFSGSGDGDKKDCRSSSESESIFLKQS